MRSDWIELKNMPENADFGALWMIWIRQKDLKSHFCQNDAETESSWEKANAGIYFVLKKENESFTDRIQRSKRTAARCGIGRKCSQPQAYCNWFTLKAFQALPVLCNATARAWVRWELKHLCQRAAGAEYHDRELQAFGEPVGSALRESSTTAPFFHHANAGGMFIPAPHMAGHRTYIRIFKYIYKNRTSLLNPFTGKEDRYKTLTLYRFYKISIILSFHHKTHMVPSLFLQMPLGRLFFFDAIFKSTLIA